MSATQERWSASAAELFDSALANYLETQEQRVRVMYNRTRAVFAEFIVAAALPGSTVVEDPAAAWDIDWTCGDRTVRLEVKCSGERLPKYPDRRNPASWEIPSKRKGWDHQKMVQLPIGHHCDAIVLTRHEGADVATGWTFRVVLPGVLPEGKKVRGPALDLLGITQICPGDLGGELRRRLDGLCNHSIP